MSRKATISGHVRRRIRRLYESGMGKKSITELVGCSFYTVYKALDPDFAEAERARQRRIDRTARSTNPDYKAYQSAYGATDKRLAQVREGMRKLRLARKDAKNKASSGN